MVHFPRCPASLGTISQTGATHTGERLDHAGMNLVAQNPFPRRGYSPCSEHVKTKGSEEEAPFGPSRKHCPRARSVETKEASKEIPIQRPDSGCNRWNALAEPKSCHQNMIKRPDNERNQRRTLRIASPPRSDPSEPILFEDTMEEGPKKRHLPAAVRDEHKIYRDEMVVNVRHLSEPAIGEDHRG